MPLDPRVRAVTERIRTRSAATRSDYLAACDAAAGKGPQRGQRLSCTNLAHGFAACPSGDKQALRSGPQANIGIVSAYNDMLSAHQPLETYPALIKAAAREVGAVAQFAGGVPAMCDGVTQGQPGMELSLFSRDVIALSTAIALSHDMFDAALCLGVCDKIVPGLLIGALRFGHLPVIFVPAGPMVSGMSNDAKTEVRKRFAQGLVSRDELLEAEAKSYHSAGTCTFYGTANSNQMLMELMGLHLPGSAFVNPGTPLREALTQQAARRVAQITALGDEYTPIGRVVDERTIVNGLVGLLATGGSTNHTLHLVAIARAAGVLIDWTDFSELSDVIPLLTRIYPNGKADVNHFHAAGGFGFLVRELISAGLVHDDVLTVAGQGLAHYAEEPWLGDERLGWRPAPATSGDTSVLRGVAEAFAAAGGLKLLAGNLGRAVIKTSAVADAHRVVEAPARVFASQEAVIDAFKAGELNRDVIVVVRFQGPRANGMPELHHLTPSLTVLQDKGFKVALVTDGRMSGASGKVPAAIHVSPEAVAGGALVRLRDGDVVRLDSNTGTLAALVDAAEWAAREPVRFDSTEGEQGMGRELFAGFRQLAAPAESGGGIFFGGQ